MPDVLWYARHKGGYVSGPLLIASGSVGAPSLALRVRPDIGFYDGNGELRFAVSGTLSMRLGGTGDLYLANNSGQIQFGSSGDAILARGGAGVVTVTSTFNFTGPSTVLPGSASASPFGYIIVQHEGASRYVPMWK